MDYKYIIIGGGMTADSVVGGIRELDKDGSIVIFSSDPNPPYDRPPLTKGLWKGDEESSIWRGTEDKGAALHLGRTITALDAKAKRITDDQGNEFGYEKLLIATGVSARRLDFGGENIIHFRSFADYKQLRQLSESGMKFAVIGGGFIGSELAAALTLNGKEVSLIFPGRGIGANLFPADLSEFVNGYYREKGVEVLSNTEAFDYESRDGKHVLKIRNKETGEESEIAADGIIAGIGTVPNVDLAKAAGLEVDNGIRVKASLQTSDPNIYAAGDVASFHDPILDEWRRVEHEDNANSMGTFAGKAMAGEAGEYTHLPFFYSDLFDLGYEAVGDVDSRLETYADWTIPFREGVVYFLRDGRVRGVLLWNVWDQVPAATALIAEPGPFTQADLKSRIP